MSSPLRQGAHTSQVSGWYRRLLGHAGEVFDIGTLALEDTERQIRDLRAKVGSLTIERDFSGKCVLPLPPVGARR